MSRLFPRLTIIVACSAMVSACTTAPATRPASVSQAAARTVLAQRASIAVDRLILANAIAQRAVAIFRPWLAPERAARVDAVATRIDTAIGAVARARDLAAQEGAIAQAETLIAEMKWIAGA